MIVNDNLKRVNPTAATVKRENAPISMQFRHLPSLVTIVSILS